MRSHQHNGLQALQTMLGLTVSKSTWDELEGTAFSIDSIETWKRSSICCICWILQLFWRPALHWALQSSQDLFISFHSKADLPKRHSPLTGLVQMRIQPVRTAWLGIWDLCCKSGNNSWLANLFTADAYPQILPASDVQASTWSFPRSALFNLSTFWTRRPQQICDYYLIYLNASASHCSKWSMSKTNIT